MTRGNFIILFGIILMIIPFSVSAQEQSGYTQYTGSGVSSNYTLNFADTLNVSSLTVNVTNNAGPEIDGYEFSKRKPVYLDNTGGSEKTDLQIPFDLAYDADMQADMDDFRFTYANGELIPHFTTYVTDSTNAIGYLKADVPANTNLTIYVNYGNATAPDGSNGANTFIQYYGQTTGNLLQSLDFSAPYVYEAKARQTSGSYNIEFGIADTSNGKSDSLKIVAASSPSVKSYFYAYDDGGLTQTSEEISWGTNTWYDLTIENTGTQASAYIDDNQIGSALTTGLPDENLGLYKYNAVGTGEQEFSFVRTYDTDIPSIAYGSEEAQPAPPALNITVSVTGDSNTTEYDFEESNEFTLIPTSDINNVQFNTTCSNYAYVVTAYWTEGTVIYNETINKPYANYSINYTPSENITSGYINATYSLIDFNDHYNKSIYEITLDDVDVTSSGGLDGQIAYLQVTDLNTSQHWINFSVLYDPAPSLISPTDTQELNYTFPPLLHDITLTWGDTDAPSYKYEVARDSGFNLMAEEGFVQTNTVTLPLEADTYYWRITGYNDTSGEYSPNSEEWEFTVNATGTIYDSTTIDGVVYRAVDGSNQEVEGVLVSIFNNTWSGSMITGSNGYYVFENLNNATTYTITASKSGYVDSTILVTPAYNETTTRNIHMQTRVGAGDQYDFHYVQFTVKTLLGTKYSGVTVDVFEGDNVVSLYDGVTGSDGSITFQLDRNKEYRITFVDATQGIDEEITLYPRDDKYNVYVTTSLIPSDTSKESGNIDVTVSKSTIDDNQAYLNVSYVDSLEETTALIIYVNQSNPSDPFNQTVIDSYNAGANSNVTHSFVITGYKGQTYIVNIEADHTTYGDVDRSYSVRYDGQADDHGFSNVWIWLGMGAIMFVGLIPKATKATAFSIVICGVGWIVVFLGWFDNLGSKGVLSITAGLTLATVLAIVANMARRRKED